MNRIITESCKTLKSLGRQALSAHWGEAVIFVLITQLISSLPAFIYNMLPNAMQTSILASLINVYTFVIRSVVSLSLANYFIRVFRQEEHGKGFNALGFGFHNFYKALTLYIKIMLFVGIGTFFFVIPGILAAINYSQAFYILADDPSKSTHQCMIESKFIMNGNKIKYVSLLLSFLGWLLLASIPSGICHIVFDSESIKLATSALMRGDTLAALEYSNVMHPIASALSLLTIIVEVYIAGARTAFFDILAGKLVVTKATDMADFTVDSFATTDANPFAGTSFTEVDKENAIDVEIVETEENQQNDFNYKEINFNNSSDDSNDNNLE